MIEHGALTDLLVTHLETHSGQLIGDGIAPQGGGWLQGQPNQDVFVPYAVLVSAGAQTVVSQLINTYDWQVNFSLRSYGGSRKQVDWMAQKAREGLEGLIHATFGTSDQHQITGIQWRGLGNVSRVDTVNPPFWQVFDDFGFICSPTTLNGFS